MTSLSWTDFPEIFDDITLAQNAWFDPPLKQNVQNQPAHIFIEGDNYPVLQKMQRDYGEKIHFIYIDPPYNTGNAFTYNDDFSTRQDVTGKKCDRHSAWLSFMARRLRLARTLLKPEGCIFIAIDQGELHYLKILCDGIFGEENFINDFMWLHGKGKKDKWSRTLQQNTLCYAKDKARLAAFREVENTNWATSNADSDERGNWFSGSISFTEKRSNPHHKNYYSVIAPDGTVWTRQWLVSREEMDGLLKENRIFFGKAPVYGKVPRVKIFNGTQNELIAKNLIEKAETTRAAQHHLDILMGKKGLFDNPKPVGLIKHLLQIAQLPSDAIILDFFAGSGTTFEAVCSLNKQDGGKRQCILVQKAEPCQSVATVEAGFPTIADLCYARCKKNAAEYGTYISKSVLHSK